LNSSLFGGRLGPHVRRDGRLHRLIYALQLTLRNKNNISQINERINDLR